MPDAKLLWTAKPVKGGELVLASRLQRSLWEQADGLLRDTALECFSLCNLDQIHSLEQRRELGRKIHQLCVRVKSDEQTILSRLAGLLFNDVSRWQLCRLLRQVFLAFSETDWKRLLRRRNSYGRPITWEHLSQLAMLAGEDKSLWNQALELYFDAGLSALELGHYLRSVLRSMRASRVARQTVEHKTFPTGESGMLVEESRVLISRISPRAVPNYVDWESSLEEGEAVAPGDSQPFESSPISEALQPGDVVETTPFPEPLWDAAADRAVEEAPVGGWDNLHELSDSAPDLECVGAAESSGEVSPATSERSSTGVCSGSGCACVRPVPILDRLVADLLTPKPSERRRGRPRKRTSGARTSVSRKQGQTSGRSAAPAPRKRGRPPKAVAEVAAPAPRKRGRPPKAVAEVAAPAPRKRGRPPKAVAEVAAPAPRKRGRPPKAVAEVAAPAPRKRGRPPKAVAEVAVPAPRKRGRPPKAVAEVAVPVPRKRGRPPKVAVAEVAAPRKRGRPPKVAVAEVAAPRKRGRPPKVAVAEVAVPAPRKRGRPPKAVVVSAGSVSLDVPRKRGRPPKAV